MKEPKTKIGFFYKFLSSKFYLTEVPIENKKTKLPHWLILGSIAKNAMKIIRSGCCITLLSDYVPIEARTFFRLLYFEDYAKYVFWTFNDNFLIDLSGNVLLIDHDKIDSCIEILRLYPVAYDEKLNTNVDGEISYCFRKIISLKKDKKFDQMFALDLQNREAVLDLLEKRMKQIKTGDDKQQEKKLNLEVAKTSNHPPSKVPFLDMITPLKGNKEETLQFIKEAVLLAGAKDLFITVKLNKGDRNPKGFYGKIWAMITFFYERGYFNNDFEKLEILDAYLNEWKNNIPENKKYENILKRGYDYTDLLNRLKKLRIN
jgi:hypothetical protein